MMPRRTGGTMAASCLVIGSIVAPTAATGTATAASTDADDLVVQHRTELANGFADVVTSLGDEFGSVIDGYGSVPLVGDQLSTLQRRIAEPFDGVSTTTRITLEDVLDEASRTGDGGVDLVAGALYVTLGPGDAGLADLSTDTADALTPFTAGLDGLGILGDRNGDGNITPADVMVTESTVAGDPEVEIAVLLTDTITASLPFQLGIELDPGAIVPDFDVALGAAAVLDASSSVQVDVGWNADLRFGVSTADGFYVPDQLAPVFNAGVFGSVPDLELDATVGLFAVKVSDGTSQAGVIQHSEIRTNLALRLEPAVGATTPNRMAAARVVRVDNEKFAQVRLSVEPRADLRGLVIDGVPVELPEISFELEADIENNDEGKFRPSSVRFDDITMDISRAMRTVGGALGQFADRALTPVGALDDALDTRIPGISDVVNGDVTLNDALPAEAAAFFSDVREVMSLQATLTAAANSSPTAFDFGCVDIVRTLPGKQYGPCIGEGYNLQYDSAFVPGTVKIHLYELETIVKMLSGTTAPLASVGLPELDARGTAGYGVSVSPFSFGVEGALDAKADLRLVFDTLGVERAAAIARAGQTPDPRVLLDGLYVQNNATGYEVGVSTTFNGGTSSRVRKLGVTVFSAGATVDVRASLGFELVDPDRNGEFRYDEMSALTNGFTRPQNLACVFDLQSDAAANVSAYANGFGFGGSVDLGWPGPDISLQDLLAGTSGCPGIIAGLTNGLRILATPVRVSGDDWLRLNVGSSSYARRFGDLDDSAGFSVSAFSQGDDVIVDFDGTRQRFTGPFDGVLVIGDDGNDTIDLRGITIPVAADGGAGSDVITGGSAADDLAGGPGGDTIRAGAGDDTIDGDTDNDAIDGGIGDDVANGGAGNDHITGGVGADRLDGDAGDDSLDGGDGDDDLRGEGGNDTLHGGNGDDTLSGGDNDDTMTGGAGADTLDGNDGNDTADGNDGDDRLGGGPGNDTLRGGNGDDTVAGAVGDDRLEGGDGDDVLRGGAGADTILGGGGSDRIDGGIDDDHAEGGDGDDTIHGGEGDDALHGDADDDTITGGLGDDSITGGDGTDDLRGNDGDDSIRGGDDDDSIRGDAGDDALHGDAGDDTINGGDGHDLITGGDDDDVLLGELGDDTVHGDGGSDLIEGGDGHDLITGGADDDVIDAGPDDDDVDGGDGDDLIDVTLGNNTARGGADDDRITAGDGDDDLFGDGGDDVIETGNGTNTVDGGEDDDLITGGDDTDTIDGGRGVDVIRSGAGDDTVTGDPGDDLADAGGEPGDQLIIDARRDPFPDWSLRDGIMVTGAGHLFTFGGSDRLIVRLDTDDVLVIDDGALPLDVESFGGSTTVRSIDFPVDLVGGPMAGDRLIVESPVVSSGRRGTLSPGEVLGVAEAPVTYTGVDTLTLIGSGGADRLDVVAADTTTFVELGDGDDLVELTVPTPIVALGVDGQAGDDTARVVVEGDPALVAGLTGVGFTAFELLDVDGADAIGTDWAFDDLAVEAGGNRILTTTDGVEVVRYLGGDDADSLSAVSSTPVSQTVTVGGDQIETIEGFDTHAFDQFGLNAGTGASLIARRDLLIGADPATGTLSATSVAGGVISAGPLLTGQEPGAVTAMAVPPAVPTGSYNNGPYEYYEARDWIVVAHENPYGHGLTDTVETYQVAPDGTVSSSSAFLFPPGVFELGTDFFDVSYNSYVVADGQQAHLIDNWYPDVRTEPFAADVSGVALHPSNDWVYVATADGTLHWLPSPFTFSATITAGSTPTGVSGIRMVDVIGDRLVVAGANRIEIYALDGTTPGVPQLTDTIVNGVDGARGVNDVRAVAFDGDAMFVASESGDSVAVFSNDGTGYRFRQVFQDLANGVRGISGPVEMHVHDGALLVSSASSGTSGEDLARFVPLLDPPEPRRTDVRFDGQIEAVSVTSGGQGDNVVARDIDRPLTIDTGAGPDTVGAGFFASSQSFTLSSGDGADVVRLKTTGPDATVTIDSGADDDDVTIAATSSGATTDVDLGTGNDTVSVFGDHLDATPTVSPSTDPGDTLRFFSSVTPTPANPPLPDGSVGHPSQQPLVYAGIEAVDVFAPPVAALAPAATTEGGSVTFSTAGTIIPTGRTVTYEWDLDGDGFVGDAVGATPTVEWNDLVAAGIDDDGVYPITVRVTTDLGDYDEATAPLTVSDVAPIGTIAPVDPNGVEGEPVFLTLDVDDAGDDRTDSWTVDWGDGTIEQILSIPPAGGVPHTYADDGDSVDRAFTVRLVSIDNEDGTFAQTSSTAFQIANTTPPSLDITGPTTTDEHSAVTIQLSSNTPDVFDEPIVIDWGDGAFERYDAGVGGSQVTQFQHTYDTPGRYEIIARIVGPSDGFGTLRSAAHTIDVADIPPTLNLAGAASAPEGTYTLDLSATVDGPVHRWDIDWGDGTAPSTALGATAAATHVFDGPSTPTITVTAHDADGTTIATKPVSITNLTPVIDTVEIAPGTVEGGIASIVVTTTDVDDLTHVLRTAGGVVVGENTTGRFDVPVADEGPLSYTLTVTDDDGAEASAPINGTAANVSPAVEVDAPATVVEGTDAAVTLTVVDPGDDTATSTSVDWGDGPTVVALTDGRAVVTVPALDGPASIDVVVVSVTDEDGIHPIGTTTTIAVTDSAPRFELVAPDSVQAGSPFELATSIVADAGDDTIQTATVDWGDGTPSEPLNYLPNGSFTGTHVFDAAVDASTVSVVVTTEDGDSPPVTLDVDVERNPIADDETVVMEEDATVTIEVAAGDTDPDDDLDPSTVILLGTPDAGRALVDASGVVTYEPAADYDGADFFEYQVCDDSGLCDTGRVDVTIVGVEDAPRTNDGGTTLSFTIDEDETLRFEPTDEIVDPDGEAVTLVGFDQVSRAGGSVSEGSLIYRPVADFNGDDSFTFEMRDEGGSSTTFTVEVSVTARPDAPRLYDGGVSVESLAIDGKVGTPLSPLSISDPEQDTFTVRVQSGSLPAGVGIDDTGAFTGAPSAGGSSAATIEACDTGGACATFELGFTVEQPAGELPATGSNSPTIILRLALLTLAAGALTLLTVRRRRTA